MLVSTTRAGFQRPQELLVGKYVLESMSKSRRAKAYMVL
jgi:hypothetical protein